MTMVFQAQMRHSPYKGQVFPSEMRQPILQGETDFLGFTAMARREWAPILMSFPQKYDFLGKVFEHIWASLDTQIERVILNSRVPGMRMPVDLGQERVFQVLDLAPEVARLQSTGQSFLTVFEGFVRHPLEIGNNELTITWYNPPSDEVADAKGRFAQLAEKLLAMGLEAR